MRIRTTLVLAGFCAAVGMACAGRPSAAQNAGGTEYHVSVRGDDSGDGSASKPLRTISAAAEKAQPGDVITVHEGVYRERINPPRGGTSEEKRIVFRCEVKKVAQPKSQTVQSEAGGRYLQRGPLVYAMAFPYELEPCHGFEGTEFKKFKVLTKDETGWDYVMDPEETFIPERDPDADPLRPWQKSPLKLKGSLLDPEGKKVPVSLVPVGCTVLRRTTFPVAEQTPSGAQ